MNHSDNRCKKLLTFNVCIPVFLIIGYGGFQLGNTMGLFSPSIKSTIETIGKMELLNSQSGRESNTPEVCLSPSTNVYANLSHTQFLVKDVPKDPSFYERKGQKLEKQFQLLEKIGFIKPIGSSIPLTIKTRQLEDVVEAYPYFVTDNAYKSDEYSFCFNYGLPKVLSIDFVEDVTDQGTLNFYQDKFENIQRIVDVTATAGFASANDFYPWAQDPEIIDAFDLQKEMKKTSRKIRLIKINNHWIPSNYVESPSHVAQWIYFRDVGQYRKIHYAYADDLYPYKVKMTMVFNRELSDARPWYIPLPGDKNYPVDVKADQQCHNPYLVGIHLNEEDNGKMYRRDIMRSLSYLKDLEERGILTSYVGDSSGKSTQFFKPTEKYADAFVDCGSFGKSSDKLSKVVLDDDLNILYYKTTQVAPQRPTWVTDEMLAGWEELNYAFQFGDNQFDTPFAIKERSKDESVLFMDN